MAVNVMHKCFLYSVVFRCERMCMSHNSHLGTQDTNVSVPVFLSALAAGPQYGGS